MGNRAVIATDLKSGVGVYLHWCGGVESVVAFCEYCKAKDYRSPSSDCYGWARLCQVIGNYFGGADSIGIDSVERLDTTNQDNGVYILDGWSIEEQFVYCYELGYYEAVFADRYGKFNRKRFVRAMVEINHNMPPAEKLSLRQLINAIRRIVGYPCKLGSED